VRRAVWLVWLGLFIGADAHAATCAVDGRVTVRAPHGVRKAAVFVDGRRRGSVRRGRPRELTIPSERTVTIRLVGRTRSGKRVVRRLRARVCELGAALRYEGRWRIGPGRATTVNSGARVFLRFTGTEINGVFDATGMKHPPQIYVWVDGRRGDARKVTDRRIRLTPRNLAAGTHTLVLGVKDVSQDGNRWQPPLESALHVLGLEPGAGTVIEAAEPAPELRFAFLGDSITQGVAARCVVDSDGVAAPAGTAEGSDCTDATIDYAWRTAGVFGAALEQVGFGEQGVTVGGAGRVPPAPQTVGLNFAGAPADPFDAQVVVLNFGTNDLLANAPADKIRAAYLELLRAVRERYAGARILALGIFGAGGTDTGIVNDAIRSAVFAFGDLGTTYVSTRGWLQPTDFTDSIHPNDSGHRHATERLADVISGFTGYPQPNPVDAPPS
jgi:lysophospholipase L1-like esterase